MKLSALPGMLVLSPEGTALGYVKCVYVCENLVTLSALGCVDGDEEEFFLPAKCVLSVGDAVIAEGEKTGAPSGVPCPVGQSVFERSGALLGRVCELDTDEKTLSVSGGGETRVFPASRAVAGEVVILYPARAKKPSGKRKNAQRIAKKAPSDALRSQNAAFPEEGGLLGKRVKRTVFFDGNALVAAGENVTPAVLRRARENNLLLQLAANTLTPQD